MSTPDISDSGGRGKFSPFCTGINKSLLTPCRRVGLSRKRKTPITSAKSWEKLNSSSSSINYSDNETTPVTSKKFTIIRKNESQLVNIQTPPNLNLSKSQRKNQLQKNDKEQESSKKELFGTFTSENLYESRYDILEKNDTIKDDRRCSKNDSEILGEDIKNQYDFDETRNLVDSKQKRKMKKRRLSSDFTYFEDVCTEGESTVEENSDDDFMINNSIPRSSKNCKEDIKLIGSKPKHLNKTTSGNKSSLSLTNTPVDNCQNSLIAQSCQIHLQKLNEDEIENFVTNQVGDKTLHINAQNKKYSLDTTSDLDYFISTPEEEHIKREKIKIKVKDLEDQIKQKKLKLENLERASVYKTKHNIPELNRLTSIWLHGCVQALKDLLTHLQAHGPIDLPTLLNNMGIPKEIVSKLPLL